MRGCPNNAASLRSETSGSGQLGHSPMLARCPAYPKEEAAGRLVSTRLSRLAAKSSRPRVTYGDSFLLVGKRAGREIRVRVPSIDMPELRRGGECGIEWSAARACHPDGAADEPVARPHKIARWRPRSMSVFGRPSGLDSDISLCPRNPGSHSIRLRRRHAAETNPVPSDQELLRS
jgi:hypothetical protein